MIDIHCHILPGIDDGSQSMEESVQLCASGRAHHIKRMVATPHFNAIGDLDNFIEIRDERAARLKEEIAKRNIDVEILCGAEIFVDDDIFFSKNLKRASINNSRYLLVEFDFYKNNVRNIFDYLDEIRSMGLIPIIAHPERYAYFQMNYDAVNELFSRSVLMQINASSLASRGSREEFELAYEMAYKGAVSFIATDAHSIRFRSNDIQSMLRAFPQDINRDLMNRMLKTNAEHVLADEPVRPNRFIRLEKRRLY
ncbi:MAG: hypothetical protein IJU45_00560 [Clostridia bacterium]|nr:hypothetical protein [Clostridia bacterium]